VIHNVNRRLDSMRKGVIQINAPRVQQSSFKNSLKVAAEISTRHS